MTLLTIFQSNFPIQTSLDVIGLWRKPEMRNKFVFQSYVLHIIILFDVMMNQKFQSNLHGAMTKSAAKKVSLSLKMILH